ncbi:MAG: hypothetical protein PWQ68_2374, partial [Thermoanaerobacteraceae bacterium]|nr:hypothetical protein [Thermoanaerobacteraceae bacterium]
MPQIDRLNMELLKPLDEARYLTAENAARYRIIMRFFYEQHQRLRYWLYKEDVFDYMKQFQNYSWRRSGRKPKGIHGNGEQ